MTLEKQKSKLKRITWFIVLFGSAGLVLAYILITLILS